MNPNTRLIDLMIELDKVEVSSPEHINVVRDAKRGLFVLFANLLRSKVDHLDSLSRLHEGSIVSKEDQEQNALLLNMIFSIYGELVTINDYCPLQEIDNIKTLLDFVKRSVIDPLEVLAKKGH